MGNIFGKIDGNDILIFIGLILVGYGLYLIWLPLAPLIIGILLFIIGAIGAYNKGHTR